MGRDGIPWFTFKSRKQQEREAKEYAQWAFPYGAAQQAILRSLLAELFPRRDQSIAMANYLTAREIYLDRYGDFEDDPDFDPLATTRAHLVRNRSLVPWEDVPLYLALLAADAAVDAALAYPSAEELRRMAEQLNNL